jgi:hypothetical protein
MGASIRTCVIYQKTISSILCFRNIVKIFKGNLKNRVKTEYFKKAKYGKIENAAGLV